MAKQSTREKRIFSLAVSIVALMREHADRWEAIDAHEIARIMFRKESKTAES